MFNQARLLFGVMIVLGLTAPGLSGCETDSDEVGDDDTSPAATFTPTPENATPTPESATPTPAGVQMISPFSITARVSGSTVADVAGVLADFIDGVDDTTRGLPSDWIVAGASNLEEGASAVDAALSLPGGHKILEVCNHLYAEQAMSFGGDHGVALPCEIGVIEEDGQVEVVLLNPEAIFGVFFQDIPEEAAAQMGDLAATVRGELEELVVAALEGMNADLVYEEVGPTWSEADLVSFGGMEHSVVLDMDIPAGFAGDDELRLTFKDRFVEILLDTLTYEGMESVGSQVDGLSTDDWRSARPYALGLPTGVAVVEMCSPTYAGAAMETGAYHAPALPCQTAIWVEGDALRVRALDPLFIFPVFFSDAPEEMMASMGEMAQAVHDDIVLVIDDARSTAASLTP